ncbi:flavin-containing monooxygenase [Rhodococcus opacus]|uniref:flavin-containing monooxygenase n=1 Tax=Rhodococcus opacus TaxID=37919 RepID=UPI001C4597AD|nr:NAD(P)/FAD-dependent oxidoreductase [Rhodococcus opacus]MBV6761980.1 NAD(P)/FAD-dependent oxidoreductase [Rhodococcus opacus]
MSDQSNNNAVAGANVVEIDAVVIGAGFGGLRMLHELRGRGLRAQILEAAPDLGGTWYWNRYPGARTDSESWTYAYSFSTELQDEWDWSERFPTQDEVHRYLRHVADKFDLRKDIVFDTRVVSAVYEEETGRWLVTTEDGKRYHCQYLVTALGLLSLPYKPDFDGIDKFEGEWYVTGRWPRENVEFAGKRVAVIGTGATAVQAIPLIAQTAAQLTVFQRTPNYVLPARNYTLTDFERESIRASYDEIWRKARKHPFGYAFDRSGVTKKDVTPDEHRNILERGWETGGFRFIFETFDDITLDQEANEIASEFVRKKIRTIVKDPDTADLLCPKDYPIVSKRPPLGHFYYEAFNRDNVSLIDVSSTPITEITAGGVRVGDDEYSADVIVFATGFDAGTGAYNHIDIRGRGGQTLREKWAEGPRTHLGISVDGFPNMFMVSGPQSPFGNIPVVVEGTVEWIGDAIGHLRMNELDTIEPTAESVESWWQLLQDYINATLLPRGRHSWFLGANIPGKPRGVLFFFGGVGTYRKTCQAAADGGYDGFTIESIHSHRRRAMCTSQLIGGTQ